MAEVMTKMAATATALAEELLQAESLPILNAVAAVLPEVRDRFGLTADVDIEWLCQSENTTYLVRYPTGGKAILRVGRLGYHTAAEIESELAWMARLNDTTKLVIPQAILGVDGKGVQVVTHPTTGAEYLCAMFTFVEGISPENLSRRAFIRQFERLGEITAILHNDVTAWPESSQAVRFTWDFDELIGPKARLGTWLDSPKLNVLDRVVLENTVEVIHDRLAAYGKGPDRFGLIHSDLRCANLLINRDQTCVIDFDDCGFSWFMYDFGAAVSFIEDHPDMRKLLRSWVKGYRRIRPLGDADVMELKTFVLLRRIFLHGWVTSHWDAADVQNGVGIRHDRVTVDLASKYLDAVAKDKVIW